MAWHGVEDEIVVDLGIGLHVQSHDLHVTTQVVQKGVACPAAVRFHDVKGNTTQQVLESATNAKSMTLEGSGACSDCHFGEPAQEDCTQEGPLVSTDCMHKEMLTRVWGIDPQMVGQCGLGVRIPLLRCPENVLANCQALHYGDMHDSDR